jgi:hypothetical protein
MVGSHARTPRLRRYPGPRKRKRAGQPGLAEKASFGDGIRLTHSPSGGGVNAEAQTANPAWDFQLLLPRYEVNAEYSFRARVVYREHCSREEILREYENWRKSR